MSDVEKAVSCYMQGYLCSQAILTTYGTKFGLDRNTALKIALPFGGGFARMGETCGAVTGALMVLGLKFAGVNVSQVRAKEKTYELVREFVKKFKNRNGTIKCKDLIKCDISTPEGRDLAMKKDIFRIICPKFVQDSAEILEQLLKEF